jgi:hypothetical protein
VTRADWVIRPALAGLVTVAAASCSVLRGDPVRDQWEDRATLPDCGSVILEQGETLRRHARSELACLRAALDSKGGGELKVRSPTVEGDPITEYYRVTPTGTTEIYVDATEDQFGDQEWSFAQCDQPTTVLDVNC